MRQVVVLLLAAACTPLSGCATALNLANEQQVYGGTQLDVVVGVVGTALGGLLPDDAAAIRAPAKCLGALALADLPFSFVADTLTLPITVPITILRCFFPCERHEPPPPPANTSDENWHPPPAIIQDERVPALPPPSTLSENSAPPAATLQPPQALPH